jgi:hypothetical protein
MKRLRTLTALLLVLLASLPAVAGDFDWMRDFNIRADADPSGFRAQLAARFKVGDAQITAVIGNSQGPQMLTWSTVLGKCRLDRQSMLSSNTNQERVKAGV